VNYCSAFQTFLEVEYVPGFGKILATKLADCFDLENETKQRITEWMEKFYEIRSNYTHGSTIGYEDLIYNNVRHIDIAFLMFQALITRQYNSGLEYLIDSPIVNIFDGQKNFESLVQLLSKARAKEYIINCEKNELIRIRNLFFDVALNTNTEYLHYENKNRLKVALNTILYLYGQLFADYLENAEIENEFYIEPLRKVKKILDSDDNFEQKLDKLPTISIYAQESNQTRSEVHLREIIPLGHIFEAFGKILEVYKE
jgi:hypothetical protein